MELDFDQLGPTTKGRSSASMDLLDLSFAPTSKTDSIETANLGPESSLNTSLIDVSDLNKANLNPESKPRGSSNDNVSSADGTLLDIIDNDNFRSETSMGNGIFKAESPNTVYMDTPPLPSQNPDSQDVNQSLRRHNNDRDTYGMVEETLFDDLSREDTPIAPPQNDAQPAGNERDNAETESSPNAHKSELMKYYTGKTAERMEVNLITLVIPHCTVETLFALATTSKKVRKLVTDNPVWREYCATLTTGFSKGEVEDQEKSAFQAFLTSYRYLRPIIENPDAKAVSDEDDSTLVREATSLRDALKLASLLDLDDITCSNLNRSAKESQSRLLEEFSDAVIKREPLKHLFEASNIWVTSGLSAAFQQRVLKLYFAESTPKLDVDEIFTYRSDSDTEEKQTSQRKISSAFSQVTSFLIQAMSDINDPASPIPLSWRDPAWYFTVTQSFGDLVVFVQGILTKTAKTISELEYLQTVPRIYAAAEVLGKNTVLKDKAESTGFSIETHLEVSLLKPMLDEFTDRQIAYIDRFARSKVKEWNDSLSQRESETEEFLWSNVPKKADKTDFMSSFKWAFSSAAEDEEAKRNNSAGTSSTHEQSAPATEFEAQTAVLLSKLRGMQKLVSFELALEVMESCKAAMQRLKTVNRVAATAAEPIFVIYLQIVGREHIQKAFENAVKVLNSYDPKKYGRLVVPLNGDHTVDGINSNGNLKNQLVDDADGKGSYAVEPLAVFTELVNVGDLVQQMVHVFFEEELVATKLVRPNNFGTPSVNAKRQFEQMLDDFLAEGLSRGIDVLMDQVEFTLTTEQLGSDYLPVPEQPVVAGQTVACEKVITLVKSHLDLLRDSTERSLFDVFQQEVGIRLFTAISKHLKRQTISVDGAINLIADTNAYYSFIVSLKQKNLSPYYEALKQLAQLFLIDKRDAKQIGIAISDSGRYNNVLTTEDIIEFVKRRQDWPIIKPKVEKVLYGFFDCMIS